MAKLGEGRDCPALLCAVRPHLKPCARFWVPQYHKDTRVSKEGQEDGEGSGALKILVTEVVTGV